MIKKELARKAVAALKEEYPGAVCSLEYQDPLQLLIAVRLSAQCTDARVNLVTPGLFARFPTLEAVSYTHLDVYKRQPVAYAWAANLASFLAGLCLARVVPGIF